MTNIGETIALGQWIMIVPLYFIATALMARHLPNARAAIAGIIIGTVVLLIAVLSLLVIVSVYSSSVSPDTTTYSALMSWAPVHLIVLSLILFIAPVLLLFSRNYMQGESCYRYYFMWILLTLAAVTLTVISNHLVLFWLGWVSISLCLHRLLMMYPERPRAVIASHKKFILARIAESLLFFAFLLLYLDHQSFYLNIIRDTLVAISIDPLQFLSWKSHIAAVLIALAALVKCAQLPVHGWLIKVVEVPTPVSALLHAGVINLGGFVLIAFAPLVSQAIVAQWLVLIVAGLSTLLAALIMTTRISIKVRLAWSTSAQMGMMLIQCALGLYELALLHLVLHSVYKAYSFLRSGYAVADHLKQRMTDTLSFTPIVFVLSALWVTVCVGFWIVISDYQGPISIWVLLACAFTTYLTAQSVYATPWVWIRAGIVVALLLGAYAALKGSFEYWLGLPTHFSVAALSLADIWATLIFISLFVCSWLLNHQAHKPRVQQLSTLLFTGLYLDEWFTRTTLSLWPVKMPVEK